MKILLIGRGKMGSLIQQTAQAAGDTVVEALDQNDLARLDAIGNVADVVIDFSRPEALRSVAAYVQRTGTPLLSGTTGYSDEDQHTLKELSEFAPVLWSANFSLGVAVLYRALRMVSQTLRPDFDIEITEAHHRQKTDAPSGTAKFLLSAVDPDGVMTPVYGREGSCPRKDANEIGVHALRGGTVAGTHTVHFFGPDEELEFTHRATSRQIFVNGALHAARLLPGRPNGLYDLQDILFQ